ncbi:MAG: SurA N-terminal domain-containing protein [Succinivibrionaceae bacterium]|nr:SurA N-terminal domain-containing protein [Succinivibrionaceae bacterium]
MLMDKMRQGAQSTAAKIIFVVIMVSFALAGIGTYAVRKPNTDPAEVNGVTIDAMKFDMTFRQQRQSMQNQAGEHFSQLLAADPQFLSKLRMQVLNNMIDSVILDQRSAKAGFHISDAAIQKFIVEEVDAFKVDGKFSNDRYLSLITRAGYASAGQYARELKYQFVDDLYQNSFTNSQFVLPYETAHATALFRQKRAVDVYTLNPADLVKSVSVDDKALAAYYEANRSSYLQPDQVKIDYVLLNRSELEKAQTVTDEEIRAYYKEHADRFTEPAKFHVEHIYVNKGKDEAAQKKQLDKITEAEKAIASGTPFEEVATKYSEDVLTAKKGGDLDWQRFGVLESEFDEAVRKLSVDNRISGIVDTKYGYHIIKFMGIKADKAKPVEEVAGEIRGYVASNKVGDEYVKAYDRLVNLANEFPDDLESIATELKLEVKHSELFDENTTVAPFDNRQLKQLAFSQTFRDDAMNSEAIRIDDANALVFRVAEFKPQYVRSLEEVKDRVSGDYRLEKAKTLAAGKIGELRDLLAGSKSVHEFLSANSVKLTSGSEIERISSEFDPAVVEKAFSLPKTSSGLNAGDVDGLDGNRYLVVLKSVKEEDVSKLSADQTMMISTQLKQIGSVRDTALMRQQLREDSDIEINSFALKQYETQDNSDQVN